MSPATAHPERRSRLAALDVLRALAVLLVFGNHMYPPQVALPAVPSVLLALWLRSGWIGVDLFFVLSGFLVSGLLFREHRTYGRISFARFFIRRGFKIYPAFYVFLLVSLWHGNVAYGPVTLAKTLAEFLFVQNYWTSFWNHTWSLAVEEHFYLLLPPLLILLAWLGRRGAEPFRALPAVCGGVAVAALCARLIDARHRSVDELGDVYRTHLRIDSLLFGVLLYYLYDRHGDRLEAFVVKRRPALALLSLALVMPAFVLDIHASVFMQSAGLTCLYLGFGGLLLLALYAEPERGRTGRALTAVLAWVGFHSYSIYLWHMPTLLWGLAWARMLNRGRLPYGVELVLYTLGSLAVGVLMAKLVETPFLRLRDRLYPSRSGPAIAR